MEEYLLHMKTLRSQLNDVEDEAAKLSIEEQMQNTTIHTLEKDLKAATSELSRLKDETEQLLKTKGQICSQILDRQKRIVSLESDSYTLTQTLELIQQERINLSARIVEKRTYFSKVAEDMSIELQEQQDWLRSEKQQEVKDTQTNYAEVAERGGIKFYQIAESSVDASNGDLEIKLDALKANLDQIVLAKFNLTSENCKMEKSIEHLKFQLNEITPEIKSMDLKTLEQEQKSLLVDNDGETEYMQTLQEQIEKLKGLSHFIRCACGGEYKVEMGRST